MNDDGPDNTWICTECIREPFLQKRIAGEGRNHVCHYCGERHPCFTLQYISGITAKAILTHFDRTPDSPSDMQYAMIRYAGHEWERDGMPVVELIESQLDTRPQIALDVQQLLEDEYSDWDAQVCGEETEFASGSFYADKKEEDTLHLNHLWERFVTSLKTQSRFINHTVSVTLDAIFKNVETLKDNQGVPVIADAGPGSAIPCLYRARWSRQGDELHTILKTPDRELGPPPHEISGANRMSARGISVFYGASSVDTAISEIRPPVGSMVVCARFSIIRPLRLLNLSALENVKATGSVFDPDTTRRGQQADFLAHLRHRMVQPVLPGEEEFSYIPTQVIAEYLADSARFNIDGIQYPSVQLSGAKKEQETAEDYNVVLFHKSSRVRLRELAAPENCEISYGHWDGDSEWDTDICVTETVEREPARPVDEGILAPYLIAQDEREPALEIEISSVTQHEIEAARFKYSTAIVRRETLELSPSASEKRGRVPPQGEPDASLDDLSDIV